MGSKTDWFENALLDYVFGGSATPVGGTVWTGLWTQALTDASTGASAGEVSGGGYARVATVRNNTNWLASSGGTVKNNAAINFGTASGNWGTVTHFGICDAVSAGNMFYWGALSASKNIQTNDSAQFAGSALVVSED